MNVPPLTHDFSKVVCNGIAEFGSNNGIALKWLPRKNPYRIEKG
jgi:hypothetical protein